MAWFGADPGGAEAFGVALLHSGGSFECAVVSCADEAVEWLEKMPAPVEAAGVDAPLWWSSAASGERNADRYLRNRLKSAGAKDVGGTVQSTNSLRGAVLIQGALLATALRRRWPELPITEAHPKALLKAQWPDASKNGPPWEKIAERFRLDGREPSDDERKDERDALLAAVAAREGSTGQWTRDLALCERLRGEQDPDAVPWRPVHYWWPEVVAKHE
jgi:predicted nuclease with RNAse H fold